jgi:hypothetical protein
MSTPESPRFPQDEPPVPRSLRFPTEPPERIAEPAPRRELSPYQTPAILADDDEVVKPWAADAPRATPIGFSVAFAVVASLLSIGGMYTGMIDSSPYALLLMLLGPAFLLAGFVLVCIAWHSANPLSIAKSTAWKLMMTVLLPPTSLLLFVPTCVGSSIFIIPLMQPPIGSVVMIIPTAIAYFICALIISRLLAWRFYRGPAADNQA